MEADDAELRASLETMVEAGIPTAVVESDFEATRPSQLSVVAGQVIEVLDRSNASWWKVSSESGEGYVPTGCLSDIGASVEALMHDVHVHMNAADEAHAEVEHHEQLQAAIDSEHDRVQEEIAKHRTHLTNSGVDHELRLPDSAPSGFHFFHKPHRHTQGTVLTPEQLYEAIPHLDTDTMVCRIAVDETWVVLGSLPDFVDLLQDNLPTPTSALAAVEEDDAVSSASSDWEEELEAVDQVVAEGAVENEIQQQWRHHSMLGVLSGGHIGPSRKWTMHRQAELENRIGVPLSDDAQVQWAVKEAEDKLRANDLDGANLAIAKAEKLEYELAKRRRRLTHDAPRLAQQLQAEAEAELKSGHLDQAEKALTRVEHLRRWHSKK